MTRTRSSRREHAGRRWPARALPLITAAVAVVLIGVGVIGWAVSAAPAHATLRDMAGNAILLDESARSAGDPAAGSNDRPVRVETDTGARFVVPSVGLSVPLDTMMDGGHEITPPGFQHAYLVGDLGTGLSHAAAGTVYVAMHSIRGGGVAPGNYLMDADTESATVGVGARITVGDLVYVVSGTRAIGKKALPADRSVWADTPGRLVVLTCLQNAAGTPSTENLVIEATLDSAASR